ncbi:hypothetical protein Ocin01_03302 [Orchesella cincta]|uniref:Ubiquitin carboxyl-terminal hydrolase MINDY n=1 Tax=Orchesella cincta TaxID=48709 RepID=A0A1D2NDP4_ORCCI|nr:hypothetical protein Ocin01_03302 [Orchesella cincta]
MSAQQDIIVGGVDPQVQEVKKVLWGEHIKGDLFSRWSQGFLYSAEERTALVQTDGGPCAVIAPVQAFLLKQVLKDSKTIQNNFNEEQVDSLLCQALTEILQQVSLSTEVANVGQATVCTTSEPIPNHSSPPPVTNDASCATTSNSEATSSKYSLVFLRKQEQTQGDTSETAPGVEPLPVATKSPTEDEFHSRLGLERFGSIEQVHKRLLENVSLLKGEYGVLQFLYSVLITKGVTSLVEEMSENNELIDPVHGHGSQCLINLLLTGRGVNYVWDNDQDLGGLTLKGICRRCEVGFLTVLERLRYCEVGSYLKNPKFPVWVVGSETHLTVIFSLDMRLVDPETPGERARRIFHSFDPDGNNFIQAVLLEDVMRTLDLYADPAYVDIMKKKLDPESLGIVLLEGFMDEFFPNEPLRGPDTFTLYHYNGLCRPSSNTKIRYKEGNAILLESNLGAVSDENKILTCLQTKWPSIDVQWVDGVTPSID